MTSYFDDYGSNVRKLHETWAALCDVAVAEAEEGAEPALVAFPYDELQELERKIVWDVTLAAESPGMPENLRDAIHSVVLKHAVNDRPVNDRTHPTVETEDDYFREMFALGGNLHTVFHEVAHANVAGFSDSPISPMRVLFARGDERRENVVAARKAKGEAK